MRRKIILALLPVGSRMQETDENAEFVGNMADAWLCFRVGHPAGVWGLFREEE